MSVSSYLDSASNDVLNYAIHQDLVLVNEKLFILIKG
jgi:hypothetical protein